MAEQSKAIGGNVTHANACDKTPALYGKAGKGEAQPSQEDHKRRRRKVALLLLLLLLLIVLLLVLGLRWRDPRARRGYYEGKTPEEIRSDLDAEVDWYSMEISVASSMQMREGETELEARIENVAANHCDQRVRIYPTNDPEDVLYESGAILPGEYVQFVPLAHTLPAGHHRVTVEFQGYERDVSLVSDEGQLLGHNRFGESASAEVTIDVLPAEGEASE